eukprot:scaffold764_cov363-Pavlova_lutheri.AAC.20
MEQELVSTPLVAPGTRDARKPRRSSGAVFLPPLTLSRTRPPPPPANGTQDGICGHDRPYDPRQGTVVKKVNIRQISKTSEP